MKRNCLLCAGIVFVFGIRANSADEQHPNSKPKESGAAQGPTFRKTESNAGAKVVFGQLPKSVQKTISAAAGNAEVKDVRKFSKQGHTCYQATFENSGMEEKLTVAEDGSLLQLQQAKDMALVATVPSVPNTGVQLRDLPEEVQKTIKEQAGSSEVGDISKSTEGGQTIYHAAFNDTGIHTDLIVDADGKLIGRTDETALFVAPMEDLQTLALSSAPEPVQKAVRKYAGSSAAVTDIDKGTWAGKTAYKITVEKDGSSRSLVIAENGELLSRRTATGAPPSAESGKGHFQNSANEQSTDRKLN